MANVSLDKDLFYQYMINNNSTSTMLNALSGNTNTGVQSANDPICSLHRIRHRRQIVCSILMVWNLLTICRQHSRQRLPVRVFRQRSRHTLTVCSMISTRSKNSQIKWWNRRWEKLFIDR